ncbi:hypothetical protein V5H54_00695 [Helicobacter pylori]
MQFLNQSLGFFNKGHFEPIDRNFIAESYNESRRSTQTIGVSKLIKEFDFKMKPIDLKEQELINLFNLKFGHFSWESHLA